MRASEQALSTPAKPGFSAYQSIAILLVFGLSTTAASGQKYIENQPASPPANSVKGRKQAESGSFKITSIEASAGGGHSLHTHSARVVYRKHGNEYRCSRGTRQHSIEREHTEDWETTLSKEWVDKLIQQIQGSKNVPEPRLADFITSEKVQNKYEEHQKKPPLNAIYLPVVKRYGLRLDPKDFQVSFKQVVSDCTCRDCGSASVKISGSKEINIWWKTDTPIHVKLGKEHWSSYSTELMSSLDRLLPERAGWIWWLATGDDLWNQVDATIVWRNLKQIAQFEQFPAEGPLLFLGSSLDNEKIVFLEPKDKSLSPIDNALLEIEFQKDGKLERDWSSMLESYEQSLKSVTRLRWLKEWKEKGEERSVIVLVGTAAKQKTGNPELLNLWKSKGLTSKPASIVVLGSRGVQVATIVLPNSDREPALLCLFHSLRRIDNLHGVERPDTTNSILNPADKEIPPGIAKLDAHEKWRSQWLVGSWPAKPLIGNTGR